MDLKDEVKKRAEAIADDTLSKFEKIAQTAKDALGRARNPGANAFANVNTLTATSAIQNLQQISQENRADYYTLSQEPAIARIVVADPSGKQTTYYICRA